MRGFNPRLPGGRRPILLTVTGLLLAAFQSTPSGGKATSNTISVRSLTIVSIHAFRGEGDCGQSGVSRSQQLFQSTPSGGKATGVRRVFPALAAGFQSTPSGGKATPNAAVTTPRINVSIHAFRGEGDRLPSPYGLKQLMFQSTPSGGKATRAHVCVWIRFVCFNPRLPGGRRPVRQRRG